MSDESETKQDEAGAEEAKVEAKAEAAESKPDEKSNEKPDAKPPINLHRAKWMVFAIVGLLSLVADQASKIWARASLPVQGHGTGPAGQCVVPEDIIHRLCGGVEVKVIDGFWDNTLSMNPGSAFGLFGGQSFARVMLSIIGIGAVGAMIWMLKKSRSDQRILHWALALVAGGAVGNLVDRIYYGVVTDFMSWHVGEHRWPTFNIADVVLVVGVGLMFIDIQKEGKREKIAKQAAADRKRAAGLTKRL